MDVFKPDHILDIQHLQASYSMEFNRKRDLLDKLCNITDTGPTLGFQDNGCAKFLSNVAWSDNCPGSMLDCDAGMRFDPADLFAMGVAE